MIQKPPHTYYDAATNRVYYDFRGTQVCEEPPLSFLCDYCNSDVDRVWFRLCRAFGVEPVRGKSMQCERAYWGACVYCRPLVNDRDWKTTAARAAILTGMDPDFVKGLHRAVFDCIDWTDPERFWESGQRRPTPPPVD